MGLTPTGSSEASYGVGNAQERAYSLRSTSDRALDVMAALDMMVEMLDGPATRDRLALFELAFCNSQQLVCNHSDSCAGRDGHVERSGRWEGGDSPC